MEAYGQLTCLAWAIFCAIIAFRRLNQKTDEPDVSAKYLLYLGLSGLLGLGLCATGILKGASENFRWSVSLWFLAWAPISLKMLSYAPRQLLHLPIGFILISSIFLICTSILVNENEPSPNLIYFGNMLMGIGLVISSIFLFRKANELAKFQAAIRQREQQIEDLIVYLYSLGSPPDASDCTAFEKYKNSQTETLELLGEAGRATWYRIRENKLTPVERGHWNRLFNIVDLKSKLTNLEVSKAIAGRFIESVNPAVENNHYS